MDRPEAARCSGLASTASYSRNSAELAVTARTGGRGFPTPDGDIAAMAVSRGFIVASRDRAPYGAAGVPVINPWEARRDPDSRG